MTRPTGKGWLLFWVSIAVCSLPIWSVSRLLYVFAGAALLFGSWCIGKFIEAVDAERTGQGR